MPPLLAASASLLDLPAHILTALFVGLVCIAMFSIAGFCSMVVNIWAQTRRNPPSETVFATKEELRAMESRISKGMEDARVTWAREAQAILTKVDGLSNLMGRLSADINREIGILQGRTSVGKS